MPDASRSTVSVLACLKCGALDPGPRELCPACFAPDLEQRRVEGQGALISWVMIRRPPTAFREDGEYPVAVVALDAGVQVTGRLAIDGPEPRPGTRVVAIADKDGVPIFASDT